MAGCGSNCSAGCCKDFSSRAERLPNLLSVEVTGEIFAKAVRNMTLRAAQRAAGMMSDEEYEEAKSKLVRWLVNAFSGENPHYEADSGTATAVSPTIWPRRSTITAIRPVR